MSNTMTAANVQNQQRELGALNRALRGAGYDQLPGPDLDALPNITAPTPQEISEAILKATDPLTDKHVATLHRRAWIAESGAPQELTLTAWTRALLDARAAIPAIVERMQADYADAGAVLAKAAVGPLKQYQSLDQIELGTLPASLVERAAEAVSAYRRLTAVHAAWRTVDATINGGAKLSWSEFADPSTEQYFNATTSRPPSVPAADPWQLALAGWALTLPSSLRAAHARRTGHADANQQTISTARGMSIKGNHRDAERFLS